MRKYELMVIINPRDMSEDGKSPLEELKKLVTQHKGKILKTDDWGEKTMTYPIKGHERGYYVVYDIEMEAEKVKAFRNKLNLNKHFLRWMILSSDEKKEK